MGAAVTVTLVADSEDLGYIQLEEALASFRRIEAVMVDDSDFLYWTSGLLMHQD